MVSRLWICPDDFRPRPELMYGSIVVCCDIETCSTIVSVTISPPIADSSLYYMTARNMPQKKRWSYKRSHVNGLKHNSLDVFRHS